MQENLAEVERARAILDGQLQCEQQALRQALAASATMENNLEAEKTAMQVSPSLCLVAVLPSLSVLAWHRCCVHHFLTSEGRFSLHRPAMHDLITSVAHVNICSLWCELWMYPQTSSTSSTSIGITTSIGKFSSRAIGQNKQLPTPFCSMFCCTKHRTKSIPFCC